jgi:hypothetical protein
LKCNFQEGGLLNTVEAARYLVVDVVASGHACTDFNLNAFERWANSSVITSPADQVRLRKNFILALALRELSGVA